jgi:hypothetical protein
MDYLFKAGIILNQSVTDMCKESCILAEDAMRICGEYNRMRNFSELGILDTKMKKIIELDGEMLPLALDEIENYQKMTNVNAGIQTELKSAT